jgi:hypothetical protein
MFKYKPRKRNQPIPDITSGQIITEFLAFQEKHQRRRYDYEEFLDELVEKNQLQKREELGFFCKGFPYLTEVCSPRPEKQDFCHFFLIYR